MVVRIMSENREYIRSTYERELVAIRIGHVFAANIRLSVTKALSFGHKLDVPIHYLASLLTVHCVQNHMEYTCR